jgi:hypothetical protein
MSMTITEKIMAKHAGKERVMPGELGKCNGWISGDENLNVQGGQFPLCTRAPGTVPLARKLNYRHN